MKRVLTGIGLAAVSLVMLAAGLSCGEEEVKVPAVLGMEFTLAAGQTAVLETEGLSLKFVEVSEDSRCPVGVECVQAGQVTCKVRVDFQGAISNIEMTQLGGSFFGAGTLGDYQVIFRVEPQPQAGVEIPESDYRLIMTVKK